MEQSFWRSTSVRQTLHVERYKMDKVRKHFSYGQSVSFESSFTDAEQSYFSA